MSTLRRSPHDERGQGAVLLAVVVVVIVVAVALLLRTTQLATQINDKSNSIATTGGGINTATDAIIQLDKTNEMGDSILGTSKELEPKLNEVVRLAQAIDGLASSINGTAGAINGTAKGINGEARNIMSVAQSINRGVETINRNVDQTIAVIAQIRSDTSNIVGQANLAHMNLSCTDSGLQATGTSPPDGHCRR